jgi:transformation/transcription domain-associated protein
MIGSDGSLSHFLVQTSLTPSARSDERMVQLFRVLNRLFDKNKESRRRHLAFNTPIIIPVWPQVSASLLCCNYLIDADIVSSASKTFQYSF